MLLRTQRSGVGDFNQNVRLRFDARAEASIKSAGVICASDK